MSRNKNTSELQLPITDKASAHRSREPQRRGLECLITDGSEYSSKVQATLQDNVTTIGLFGVHYQFPPDVFKILFDLHILQHLAKNNINPKKALFEIFQSRLGLLGTSKNSLEEAVIEVGKKIVLCTTTCIMDKLKGKPEYKLLMADGVFKLLRCKNKCKGYDYDACVMDMIGSKNESKYYYATMSDHELYSKMRKKPAVPVIVGIGEGLVLEKWSDRQHQLFNAFGDKIPQGYALEEMNAVILFYKTYFRIKYPPQVLLDGPSLRYLASNGLSIADVANVVGTTRNLVQTTSCILRELRKEGTGDVKGALVLANGLMLERCDHFEDVSGSCYESVLRKGLHIGASFESSNSCLAETMTEGVPFICADDNKELFVMPPSAELIRSKGDMPVSEMNLLLALSKSQTEKKPKRASKKDRANALQIQVEDQDQKAVDKRISKKERRAQKRKNEAGPPSSKKTKYQAE